MLEYTVAKELLKKITELPGNKIVTISTGEHIQPFDIDNRGKVGYQKQHKQLLLELIVSGLVNGGGLIVRQFLSIKTEVTTPNGKRFVPIKNIYGIRLENKTWYSLSANEVEVVSCTAPDGTRLPKEEAVRYCTFLS